AKAQITIIRCCKMDLKGIGLIVLIGIVLWLYVSNITKSKEIMNLQINSKFYQEQTRKLDVRRDSILLEIKKSRRVIDSLNTVLSNIPTDADIIYKSPIRYVSTNSAWSDIIRPIESAIDSTNN